MSNIPKAMVDCCVTSIGNVDPATWKLVDTNGPFANKLRVYEITAKAPKQRKLIKTIKAISNFAEHDNIQLYTYDELRWEEWNGFQSMGNNLTPLAAFTKIRFQDVPPPIDRSKFVQTTNWTDGKVVDKFLDFLLEADASGLERMMKARACFSDFERQNAAQLKLFKDMCSNKAIGEKRKRDVFHLWAAECSHIDYFLTTDLKFLRSCNNAINHKKFDINCKVVSPADLVKELSIPDNDIHIPKAGTMFLMSGREYRHQPFLKS